VITVNETSSRTGWRMLCDEQRRADYPLSDPAVWDLIDAPQAIAAGGMACDVTQGIAFLSGEQPRAGWWA
jgi:hypothetical protein